MTKFLSLLRRPAKPAADSAQSTTSHISSKIIESAQTDIAAVLKNLNTEMNGLSEGEAAVRLKTYGLNEVARGKRTSVLMRLAYNVKNPLVVLLSALGLISYLTGDMRATAVFRCNGCALHRQNRNAYPGENRVGEASRC